MERLNKNLMRNFVFGRLFSICIFYSASLFFYVNRKRTFLS